MTVPSALSEEDQDAVLTAMADGEIEFEGLSAERSSTSPGK
jgi:hypothetical protein